MVVRVSLLLPFVAVLIFSACGGGDKTPTHQKIDGPFVELFGAQTKTFSLAADKLAVMCKPKPGLKEFEFEAATSAGTDGGNYFRITLKDYTGPGDFELEFDIAKPQHKIEVGVPAQPKGADGKDYKYTFWYHLRTDTNETYRSHCDLNLTADEGTTKTHYVGLLDCTMLFAASSSHDSNPGFLNAYVDLMAKFECDY
jgi:hypothetical protein